jgi:hypothetical protein
MFDTNLIVGIALISIVLLYSAFKLWEIQHQLFAVIFFFSALAILLLIPSTLYENQSNCYLVVQNTTVSIDGTDIQYNYEQNCYPINSTALNGLHEVYSNINVISYWYLFIIVLLMLFGDMLKLKIKQRFNK